jgi:hypothetical protein
MLDGETVIIPPGRTVHGRPVQQHISLRCLSHDWQRLFQRVNRSDNLLDSLLEDRLGIVDTFVVEIWTDFLCKEIQEKARFELANLLIQFVCEVLPDLLNDCVFFGFGKANDWHDRLYLINASRISVSVQNFIRIGKQ